MREINSVQHRLEWVQPGALKMYYELRSDNELIATWVSEAYWARSRPRRVRTDAGHSSASDSSRRERRFALADRTRYFRHQVLLSRQNHLPSTYADGRDRVEERE
jgi:hypothetical protein